MEVVDINIETDTDTDTDIVITMFFFVFSFYNLIVGFIVVLPLLVEPSLLTSQMVNLQTQKQLRLHLVHRINEYCWNFNSDRLTMIAVDTNHQPLNAIECRCIENNSFSSYGASCVPFKYLLSILINENKSHENWISQCWFKIVHIVFSLSPPPHSLLNWILSVKRIEALSQFEIQPIHIQNEIQIKKKKSKSIF